MLLVQSECAREVLPGYDDIVIEEHEERPRGMPGSEVASCGVTLIDLPKIAQGKRESLRNNFLCSIRRTVINDDDLEVIARVGLVCK